LPLNSLRAEWTREGGGGHRIEVAAGAADAIGVLLFNSCLPSCTPMRQGAPCLCPPLLHPPPPTPPQAAMVQELIVTPDPAPDAARDGGIFFALAAVCLVLAVAGGYAARHHNELAGFVLVPALSLALGYDNLAVAVHAVTGGSDGTVVVGMQRLRACIQCFVVPLFLVAQFELSYEVRTPPPSPCPPAPTPLPATQPLRSAHPRAHTTTTLRVRASRLGGGAPGGAGAQAAQRELFLRPHHF
jgi:hypothetical protein